MAQVSSHPKGSQLDYWLTYSETVSALAAVLLLYTGFEWYRYKSFKRAFLSQPASFAKWAIVLLVLGGLLAYTVSPKTMEPYTKTVITGKIESNIPFSKAYLTDNFIKDTIAIIPIKNNQFNFSIPQDMPLANYTVNFDEMYNVSFIMGNKDSIYIDMQVINKDSKVTVTGTRLAENQYAKDLYTWSSVSYYIEQNMFIDKPDYISDELVSDWKDAIKESDNFRTVDNYIPGEDYLKKRQILSTIEYLNYWNTFKKKRAAMYPDAKTVDTEGIKEMKALVRLNDESLLSEKSYFDYIKTGLIAPNKEDIDEDTKSLLAITKLPKGKFRDKMLYWQLNESLKGASATSERDKLLAQYNSEYTNKKFSTYTTTNYKLIESLGKGKPAPLFDAVTLDNKPFNLADLKGKHVVIDTWATWCAPCREQSPLFEKMAIKYKGQPVQFAAVSIDRKIDDWFADAKTKSKSVLQLHINNEKKFSKEYDITGIPRFILIDPQGNYVESAMPYPNDHLFEKMLRDALKLPEEK
jgi:thiol-disulfide isomerase/thioredoxin